MGIFKNKKSKKAETVMAKAPEEPETPAEQQYVETLNGPTTANPVAQPVTVPQPTAVEPTPKIEVREVPVCLSQSQINNLIIENNIMLKQIISEMDED